MRTRRGCRHSDDRRAGPGRRRRPRAGANGSISAASCRASALLAGTDRAAVSDAGRLARELHPEAYRDTRRGRAGDPLHRSPDEFSTNLYTSPQIGRSSATGEEWVANPSSGSSSSIRRTASGRSRRTAVERGRRAVPRRIPDAREGRAPVWIRDEAVPVLDDDGSPLFWRGVMLDITEQKHAEDKLRWSLDVLRRTMQQRRELARASRSAQEEERRRIAADIHDDPIQVMSAVDMRLQMLRAVAGPVTGRRSCTSSSERCRGDRAAALAAVRAAPGGVRSRRAGGGAPAVSRAHGARRPAGRRRSSTSSASEPPPDLRARSLYRIAQEAITNARKHADATRPVEVAVGRRRGGGPRDRRRRGASSPLRSTAAARTPRAVGDGRACRARRRLVPGRQRSGRGHDVECWLPVDGVDRRSGPAGARGST